MFIEFQVGNFRSFRDIQKFSMQAAPLRANDGGLEEGNVFQLANVRLLKTKAIYGSNASGKSNLTEAFAAFMHMVSNSIKNENVPIGIWENRFKLLTDWDDQPIFFQYSFILDKIFYRYGFQIIENKVSFEWLFGRQEQNEKEYFFRSADGLKIDENLFNQAGFYIELALSGNNEIFRTDSLFLTAAALNGSLLAARIRSEIREVLIEDGSTNEKAVEFALNKLNNGTSNQNELLIKFLKAADVGIDDLELDDIPDELPRVSSDKEKHSQSDKSEKQKMLFSLHSLYDDNGQRVKRISVPFFDWESGGTKKLLGIGALMLSAFDEGRTLIIDEFDARFHPNLTLKVVELFQSEETNPHGAQLIFVTHDSGLLRRANLRRDQICFVDKDKYGISTLRTLIEYKGVRKDASYEKEYLQGSYAGIPFLNEMDSVITQIQHENELSETK